MKKIIFPFLVGLLCLTSCDEILTGQGEAPVLGEIVFDKVTSDSIVCQVKVSGGNVTDCKIYYDTTKSRVTNGSSSYVKGQYHDKNIQGVIGGLTANKKYYIKVHGMNEFGTSETEIVEQTTLPVPPSIDDNKNPSKS